MEKSPEELVKEANKEKMQEQLEAMRKRQLEMQRSKGSGKNTKGFTAGPIGQQNRARSPRSGR